MGRRLTVLVAFCLSAPCTPPVLLRLGRAWRLHCYAISDAQQKAHVRSGHVLARLSFFHIADRRYCDERGFTWARTAVSEVPAHARTYQD